MYSFNPPFWPFIAFESTDGTEHPYPTPEYPSLPSLFPPTALVPENLPKCKGVNYLQVSPKHKPEETQAMGIYLGIHRIALFWIWTVSEDIFGWTYLYLYLYLNRCICICICIWINVELNICICICIWKIQIFVFVFVFVFDKTYLTPALNYQSLQFVSHYIWRTYQRFLRASQLKLCLVEIANHCHYWTFKLQYLWQPLNLAWLGTSSEFQLSKPGRIFCCSPLTRKIQLYEFVHFL